jgi:hypothetical protein
LALAAPFTLAAQFTTQLAPATDQAFEDYRKSVEAQLDWRAHLTGIGKPGHAEVKPAGKNGTFEVKNGLIHDWAGGILATGATVEQVLKVLQNYDNYKNVYQPEVVDSKLLSHEGATWRPYLKIVKKKALTAVINSEYEVEYRPLGEGRWAMLSRSTKMAEVENGKELAPGTGHGFLWRLNAYWVIEPRPGGVYLECRTLSLSRNIPTGLGWIIRPIVSSLPRDSLSATLEATVRALHVGRVPRPARDPLVAHLCTTAPTRSARPAAAAAAIEEIAGSSRWSPEHCSRPCTHSPETRRSVARPSPMPPPGAARAPAIRVHRPFPRLR